MARDVELCYLAILPLHTKFVTATQTHTLDMSARFPLLGQCGEDNGLAFGIADPTALDKHLHHTSRSTEVAIDLEW